MAGFSITALSVLRCLAGSPYAVSLVGSATRPGPARSSRHREELLTYPADHDLVGFLRGLRARFDENPVLLLTEDTQVIEIARGYPDVADDYRILLPDHDRLEALQDKTRFARLAWDAGHAVPETRILDSAADLETLDLPYPFVLKPFLRHSSKIEDPAQLAAYLATLDEVNRSSLVVQEWIPGGDDQLYFCFLLLDDAQELVASFLGRKLRQNPPQSGTTSFGITWDDPQLVAQSVEILRALGCRGYCALEYKYDARDGRYVIMEPTVGRVNQQIALTMAAGVNFPRLAADHAYGAPVAGRTQTREARWIHEFGDAASLRAAGRIGDFPKACAGADVRVLFTWDDPLPLASRMASAARRGRRA